MAAAENSTNDYVTGDIPYCFESGHSELCMPRYFEAMIIGVNTLSLALNIFHMMILCRLKKIRGTVFHRIIIITSVVDMLDVISKISTTACVIRVNIIDKLPLIHIVSSVHEIITGYKFAILGVSAIDRWLSLAKPFQYDATLMVRKFNLFAFLVAVPFAVYSFLKNALLVDEYCIETGFGFKYPRSSISHIILFVVTVVNCIGVNVFILLIAKHLIQMRLRSRLTESDRLLRQAAKYVIVTCILFHICFIGYLIIVILRVSEYFFMAGHFSGFEYLALVSILFNSCYGILNIVTFAWYTAGYRRAVTDLLHIKQGRVGTN